MKRPVMLALIGLVAAVLLASSAVEWATVVVSSPVQLTLTVTGQAMFPLVPAIGVVILGAVGALTIAKSWGRQVLGAIVAISSVGLASSIAAQLPALMSTAKRVVALALAHGGVQIDAESIEAASVAWTPWPVIALLAAVIGAAGGVVVILRAPTWTPGPRRFERSVAADGSDSSTWDAQNAGDDPTARVHE